LNQIRVQLALVQGSVSLSIFIVFLLFGRFLIIYITFLWQVGIGIAVVVFGLVFTLGDFLPYGR
jgi:hypothetical protein